MRGGETREMEDGGEFKGGEGGMMRGNAKRGPGGGKGGEWVGGWGWRYSFIFPRPSTRLNLLMLLICTSVSPP